MTSTARIHGDTLIGITDLGGSFQASTRTQAKEFKTLAGAVKWLAGKGYTPTGGRA